MKAAGTFGCSDTLLTCRLPGCCGTQPCCSWSCWGDVIVNCLETWFALEPGLVKDADAVVVATHWNSALNYSVGHME